MSVLSFIEKQTICRLFGISDGFIFKYWSDKGVHYKSTTKELIYDSCGINIFEDAGYKGLSQQKCIQKIWDECSPQIIAKLLKALSDYFCFKMGTNWWSDEDNYDYQQVQQIIERLKTFKTVELPKEENIKNLKLLLEDIEDNIKNDKPELVVDRLHTFASEYLRNLCHTHLKQPTLKVTSIRFIHLPECSKNGMLIMLILIPNLQLWLFKIPLTYLISLIVYEMTIALHIPTICFQKQKQNMLLESLRIH